ncbi:hypothetical protein [Paenibacillus sp. Root444D2]|nr:hypothetical protein [Paenibacillus sp. Root444D2]
MNTKKADYKWVWVSSLLMISLLVYVTIYPPVSKNESEKTVAKVNI